MCGVALKASAFIGNSEGSTLRPQGRGLLLPAGKRGDSVKHTADSHHLTANSPYRAFSRTPCTAGRGLPPPSAVNGFLPCTGLRESSARCRPAVGAARQTERKMIFSIRELSRVFWSICEIIKSESKFLLTGRGRCVIKIKRAGRDPLPLRASICQNN